MKIGDIRTNFPDVDLQKAILNGKNEDMEEGFFATNLFQAENLDALVPKYLQAIDKLQDQELAVRLADKCQFIYKVVKDAKLKPQTIQVCDTFFAKRELQILTRQAKKERQTKIAQGIFRNGYLLNVLLNGKKTAHGDRPKGYATFKEFHKNVEAVANPVERNQHMIDYADSLLEMHQAVQKMARKLQKADTSKFSPDAVSHMTALFNAMNLEAKPKKDKHKDKEAPADANKKKDASSLEKKDDKKA